MANLAEPVGGAAKEAINAAARDAGKLLKDHYYRSWDSGTGDDRFDHSRKDDAGQLHSKIFWLYHATARINWNGHEATRDHVDTLVRTMPATRHTINTMDVQPCLSENHSYVTVHGSCRYDDTTSRPFFQQFIVWKDQNAGGSPLYYIISDTMRWLGEDDGSVEDRRDRRRF
eukprot:TRINITY_DN23411_c0_g1_i1.p1 TRINITY_DN23411_c0_g1~~TRINITY_DN23411_c0_g1_i1.p1  ORF type:complete len:172 (+),score=41.88 TRINITY_DN23411_c0_g1_i1:93-608(+)